VRAFFFGGSKEVRMAIAKTEEGLRVLKDRRGGLSPRQRAALILADGQRSIEDLLAATAGGGITRADIERLMELGLVAEQLGAPRAPQAPNPPGGAGAEDAPPEFTDSTSQLWDRYVRAYGIATELGALLSRRDAELSLAIDAAGSIEELEALAPRIRAAVGPVKFARLEAALRSR
jgi:hypothetical protein